YLCKRMSLSFTSIADVAVQGHRRAAAIPDRRTRSIRCAAISPATIPVPCKPLGNTVGVRVRVRVAKGLEGALRLRWDDDRHVELRLVDLDPQLASTLQPEQPHQRPIRSALGQLADGLAGGGHRSDLSRSRRLATTG